MTSVDIIVPCYNEEEGLALFYQETQKILDGVTGYAFTYILVDESKFVKNICDKFPIPVEVTPRAINYVRQAILNMGAETITLRLAKGKDGPVVTESGNIILDTVFRNVDETLEKRLKSIVGVVETGLFIGYNVVIEK